MQVTDARGMSAAEIAALMQKKAFDECELSPGVQAGVTAMFGAPLTAAQVVDKIVADVRENGDDKLLYYTNLLDKAGLTAQNIRVSEAEFAEARQSVDPEVVEAIKRAIANVRRFHEGDAGRFRRYLCAGRHGGLSFLCDHECCTGNCGWCAAHRDGSAAGT